MFHNLLLFLCLQSSILRYDKVVTERYNYNRKVIQHEYSSPLSCFRRTGHKGKIFAYGALEIRKRCRALRHVMFCILFVAFHRCHFRKCRKSDSECSGLD